MKRILFALATLTLATGCAPSASDVADQLNRAMPGTPNNSASTAVIATYVSDCQMAGGMSYRVIVNQTSTSLHATQQTFAAGAGCDGGSTITESAADHATIFTSGQDEVTVQQDGLSIKAKLVDDRTYTIEPSLFVRYEGTVGANPASLFAEIVDNNEFAYIWTMENDVDLNPRSNPWVNSGSATSQTYQNRMQSCDKASIVDVVVKAGHFRACLVTDGATKVWYGNAPIYGVVKYDKPANAPFHDYYMQEFASRHGIGVAGAMSLELVRFSN